MRIILLTLLLSLTILESCKGRANPKPKEIVDKHFNWKITIPPGFESVSAEKWAQMQNKGVDAIEKTYGGEVENNAKTIFVFSSDQLNYFESNYQLFDTAKDGDYLQSVRDVSKVIYGTFEAQMPNAKLDSSSSQEKIDGKIFQTFKVSITFPNKKVMECWMYSRLFKNKELGVNILTVDKDKQKVLLEAWRNSTFGVE